MASSSFIVTLGCSRTSGRKFQAGMPQQTTSVSALTVAVRSAPASNAISPK